MVVSFLLIFKNFNIDNVLESKFCLVNLTYFGFPVVPEVEIKILRSLLILNLIFFLFSIKI